LKKALQHLASIQTGFFAKSQAAGDVIYLHAKYYDEDGLLTTEPVPDLNSTDISKKHLLRPGDVLFAAKGAKNFATCFTETETLAAASTSFFVIRIHDRSILPPFLTWYLNHPTTLKYIKTFARGTSMVSISKEVLSDLAIPIPSIEKQQLILKIHDLRSIEKRIEMNIFSLRQTLHHRQLFTALGTLTK
jgi:hypothetical protein